MHMVEPAANAAPERRAHRRADYRGRIWLAGAQDTHWGRIRDLSSGGLGVDMETSLRAGARVRVGFDLPRGGRVVAQAVVARGGADAAGLRFVDLDTASAHALHAFVLQHA